MIDGSFKRSLLLAALMPSMATAGISLTDSIIDLWPTSSPRKDVLIFNTGDEREFVVNSIAKIENPGLPNEKRIEIENPESISVLVAPNRMILEPNQKQMLRIASFGNEDVESIYRVSVQPVDNGRKIDGRFQLKIHVGYDLLVINRPQTPVQTITYTRNGDSFVVKNTGNSNVLLTGVKHCVAEKCEPMLSKRIYAGATYEYKVPEGSVVKLTENYGNDSQYKEL